MVHPRAGAGPGRAGGDLWCACLIWSILNVPVQELDPGVLATPGVQGTPGSGTSKESLSVAHKPQAS